MNTPKSRQGNLVRSIIYLIGYFIVFGARRLATIGNKVSLWGSILFVLLGLMMLIFYVYRFNREARFFERNTEQHPFLNNFRHLSLMTVVIAVLRILVSYLQTAKGFGYTTIQTFYHTANTPGMFWLFILSEGVIIAILQQFLTNGFLFNYFFREDTIGTAVLGIVVSALIFTLLNFSAVPLFFLSEFLIGAGIAWTYLKTQTMWAPIFLAVVNSVLFIILY